MIPPSLPTVTSALENCRGSRSQAGLDCRKHQPKEQLLLQRSPGVTHTPAEELASVQLGIKHPAGHMPRPRAPHLHLPATGTCYLSPGAQPLECCRPACLPLPGGEKGNTLPSRSCCFSQSFVLTSLQPPGEAPGLRPGSSPKILEPEFPLQRAERGFTPRAAASTERCPPRNSPPLYFLLSLLGRAAGAAPRRS